MADIQPGKRRRGGTPSYIIFAEGDRCEADYFLRHARKAVARCIEKGCREHVIEWARRWEARELAEVEAFEAAMQIGEAAR